METVAQAMAAKGVKQRTVADFFGVNRSSVNLVIHGYQMSQRIFDKVDELMGWKAGTAQKKSQKEKQTRITQAKEAVNG